MASNALISFRHKPKVLYGGMGGRWDVHSSGIKSLWSVVMILPE